MTIRPLFRIPLALSDPDDTIPIADYNAGVSALPGLLSWHTAHPDYLTRDAQGRVSVLHDRTGNGSTFLQDTAARQPLYQANRINGHGAVLFDPARSDVMSWNGIFPNGLAGHHSKVVVLEALGTVSGTSQQILSSGSGIQDGKHYLTRALSTTGVAQAATDSNSDMALAQGPMLNGSWNMLIGSFTAGVGIQSLSVNGALAQATNPAAQVALTSLYLGGLGSGAGGLSARIAEILIFNIDLHADQNSAALAMVHRYIETTYGITAT